MTSPRFDPTKFYTSIVDIDGSIYAVQNGVYYDKYGNSWTAPHTNTLGWRGVHPVLVPRTSAQLAAAPATADLGLGFQALFYASDVTPTSVSPLLLYVATTTAYVPAGGTGSGTSSFAALTGQPTDNANLSTALNLKENVPLNWDGTTPALASSTNPIPLYGSNSFLYTGAGGATLDGNTFQTGDVALWNGTVFTKYIFGGGYLGSFSSLANAQTAYPAASNVNCTTLVAGNFAWSNGTSWLTGANLDGSLHLPATQMPALTGDVTTSAGSVATTLGAAAPVLNQQSTNAQSGTTYTFALSDAGQNTDLNNASAITATIPPHSSVAFPVGVLVYWTQAGAGAVTIAAGAGVTIVKRASYSLTTSEQYAGGYAYQTSQDNWRVYNG